MTILQFANNATSTLASPINSIQTTIFLASGTGNLFPTPILGKAFYATIYNTSSTLDEIVLVTARNNDTLTVVRGQDNTIAQTFTTGATIGMYPTAATMNNNIQLDQLQLGTYTATNAGGTANALTAYLPSNLTSIPDNFSIVLQNLVTNTGAATLQLTLGSTIFSAYPIVTGYQTPLVAGNTGPGGYPLYLIWSSIFQSYVLINPTAPIPTSYNVYYFVGGGAGGGGGDTSAYTAGQGGGGAGGYLQGITTLLPSTSYAVNIGAGGAANTNGGNSSVFTLTSIGGGHGGNSSGNGIAGGSGGGAGGVAGGYGNTTAGGAATVGQGSRGGNNNGSTAGMGGGGAGATGDDGVTTGSGTNGGVGGIPTIPIGLSVPTYCAGGGGGGFDGGGGAGGDGFAGSGGAGNPYGGTAGSGGNGSANSGSAGGGGGAAVGGTGGNGGSGGSGIVYVSYANATQKGTGGTVTSYSSGGTTYWVHKFTSSGYYVS